jgi:hypothetical protein
MDILTVKNMPSKGKQHPNGVDPKDIVDGVLSDLGHERISYGHWKHAIFRYLILWRQCNFWFKSASPSTCSSKQGNGCPFTKFKFW